MPRHGPSDSIRTVGVFCYIRLLNFITHRRFGALLLLSAVQAGGQSLLLKAPGTEPPLRVQFTTPAGSDPAAPQLAAVDTGLTMVFDAAVLDSPQWKTWSAGLAALYTRNRKPSLAFVTLAQSAAPREVFATSRQQVIPALKSLAAPGGAAEGPLPFAALLAYVRLVPAPARGWKQVLM